ncbi:LysR family transcriptional regulator [Sagittula sp. NFXS13]|uniref:LysR family transcriptional regulator n=1 Tax=Sagittula sp. NFXS13 TaxID=2819095 RepID=UPI0032DF1D1F
MPRHYDLPSLNALLCFEAAARNLSFKTAATELNVTPAAVSHQIRRLESDLGSEMFRRQHRGVELTEAGAYLFVALQRGFEGIAEAVRDVRAGPDTEDVVVQTTTAVSAFWLTPQLTAFWKARPDIIVSQLVSDAASAPGRADLSIHYGSMAEDDPACLPLFRDDIIAVGTSEFAATRGINSIHDLHGAPLIHVVAEGMEWTGWSEWFAKFGLSPPPGRGIVVNNHMIALQLARDGVGAVLGWTGLIDDLLDSGALVPLVAERMTSPQTFYLQTHTKASRQALVFRDWLAATKG